MLDFKIDESWKEVLQSEFKKPYFQELKIFLTQEMQDHTIYPKTEDIFNAYNATPLKNLKVVIVGQDPYHGKNQAHGLAFSVSDGTSHPPSLANIFKELKDDMGCEIPTSGNLEPWASRGVFLINTVLSVRAAQAHSHKNRGWERLVDSTISTISRNKDSVVFILWGKSAQKKSKLIDTYKHLVLNAPHPSPLSSYRGFFGSKPFSKANTFLENQNIEPISWCI